MPDWLRPTDVCVVTGGCNGLGAAILKALAAAGCQTVALDIAAPEDSSHAAPSATNGEASSAARETSTTKASTAKTSDADAKVARGAGEQTAATQKSADGITTAPVPSTTVTSKVASASAPEPSACAVNAAKDVVQQFTEKGTEEDALTPSLVIKCDVRRQEDLARARQQIFDKFQRHPSVLICNAGVRRPLNSIDSTEFEDIEETIEVNLAGPLKCMRTFLPDILEAKRGFVVTVGSALGLVCPKGLSVYGASKAGILGFHEALEQEVAPYKDVHALLVCPGQIDTAMFADVQTPSERFAPIVEPEQLAKKIVKRIRRARTSTIYAPVYVRYLSLVRAVPTPIASLARKWSGVDKVYDGILEQRQKAAAAAALAESVDGSESVPGLEKSGSAGDASVGEPEEPQEKSAEGDAKLCVPKGRHGKKRSASEPSTETPGAAPAKPARSNWFRTNIFHASSAQSRGNTCNTGVSPFGLALPTHVPGYYDAGPSGGHRNDDSNSNSHGNDSHGHDSHGHNSHGHNSHNSHSHTSHSHTSHGHDSHSHSHTSHDHTSHDHGYDGGSYGGDGGCDGGGCDGGGCD